MKKHSVVSHVICLFLFLICPLPIFGQVNQTRAKDKEVIASHVIGIVNNVVNLVNDPKDENEIGANIVGLFTNILGCIFAATKRSNASFTISQEEIDMLVASLDPEIIQEVQKAVMIRMQEMRNCDDV